MASDYITVNDDTGAAIPRKVAVVQAQTMPDSSTADVQVLEVALGYGSGVAAPVAAGRDLGSGKGAVYVDQRPILVKLANTPTITASSAYTAGNCIGGVITLSGAARGANGSGRIVQLAMVDTDHVLSAAAVTIYLFDAAPTAVDKTAFAPTSGQLVSHFLGAFTVGTFEWHALGTIGVASDVNINWGVDQVPYLTDASGDLYAVIVTAGTPTFTTTASVTLTLLAYQD